MCEVRSGGGEPGPALVPLRHELRGGRLALQQPLGGGVPAAQRHARARAQHDVAVLDGDHLAAAHRELGAVAALEDDQQVALLHPHAGLAGVVHHQDVRLPHREVALRQVVAPQHPRHLVNLQLDLWQCDV